MPTYKVNIGIEEYECEIEADNEDEAYKLAFDEMYMNAMPWWSIKEIEEECEDEED